MPVQSGLSLDRYAYLMGIHPLHFHQIGSFGDRPQGCGDVWLQYDWQGPTKVSRESIALAIRDAENDIEDFLGFPVYPKWYSDIYIQSRGSPVVLPKAYYIEGGIRAQSLIEAGATITYTDTDADTYFETATISVVTDITDPSEIQVTYPGETLDWQIRSAKVSIASGIATITMPRQELIKKMLIESFNPEQIDGIEDASFLDTVDVYRVYNDPSTQVILQGDCRTCGFERRCNACEFDEFTGCMRAESKQSSIVHVTPSSWDVTKEAWIRDLCFRNHIYAGRYNFKAGWTGDNIWEEAIAYLATARINTGLCACPTVKDKFDWYHEDITRIDKSGSYRVPRWMLEFCPWGYTRGAMFAFSIAWKHRMPQGAK